MEAEEPGAGRVTLRRLVPEDAGALFAAIGNAETYAALDIDPPGSADQIRAQITRQNAGPPGGGALWLNWAVRVEGVVAGFVQATVTGEEADFAYVLGAGFWRRGIGRRAARLAMAELAARHGVTRLIADTDRDNAASQALLKRLGFRRTHREGRDVHFRHDGPLP
ncbi:GNAT family N-acetyltransferase [Pseudoroseicyclus tamaricis]|uniref:GNAT family N-acetyltransferase n=1 Tax=Pseudoroseicyclus tamaricis TaxID=2705421 RepID=A0A6B2JZK5_9RHOB|nr:GNAT family N-acetyltransferase [Pseudoroseicyclus tamaricis]NDV01694.1 GNAT family N-acetyltransferase [Pseudoroseicyclus tamaricis]